MANNFSAGSTTRAGKDKYGLAKRQYEDAENETIRISEKMAEAKLGRSKVTKTINQAGLSDSLIRSRKFDAFRSPPPSLVDYQLTFCLQINIGKMNLGVGRPKGI